MVLKKPSDFFDKNNDNSSKINREEVIPSKQEKLESIAENFGAFKNNSSKLSEFTETFNKFKDGFDKVEILSKGVEEIKENIKGLAEKKNLDESLAAHLLYVEETLEEIQNKVKLANSKTVIDVRDEFLSLSEVVNNFIEVETPRYKKLISESEDRIDDRFNVFKTNITNDVSNEISSITDSVKGINEENLFTLKEDVASINEKVKSILENDLPEYKRFFAETELRTEDRIGESEKVVEEKIELIEKNYKSLQDNLNNHGDNLEESKLNVKDNIEKLSEEISSDIDVLDQKITVVDLGLTDIQEKLKNNDLKVSKILIDEVNKIENLIGETKDLSKIFKDNFKNREISNDKKLEDYSNTLNSFSTKIEELENNLSQGICDLQENLDISTTKEYEKLQFNVEEFQNEFTDKLTDLKVNFTVNEKHIDKLRDEFKELLETLNNIDNIEEKSKELNANVKNLEEVLEQFDQKSVLKEGLLNEPPNVAQSITGRPPLSPEVPPTRSDDGTDPLTPLNQRYATFQDLANHYRLFVNRVSQQLSTLGGGGAVSFDTLDDVGIATYGRGDAQGITAGNVLIYDENLKIIGIASTALGGGGGGGASIAGIDTTGTSYFNDIIASGTVTGNLTGNATGLSGTPNITVAAITGSTATFSGNVSVGGTLTYEDVTNVDSVGMITARKSVQVGENLSVVGLTTLGSANGIGTVYAGLGNTALWVDGDARIIGILTVGRESITIDGDNSTITAGIVTISNSSVTIGDNVSITSGASGINSAPNVFYVAKDGSDSNNGTSIDNAKLTIAGAVGIATSGSTIKVLSGNYQESNPIEVPAFCAIVGDDQRSVTVTGSTAHKDIFHVRKGCKLANMTFSGHTAPAAAVGFPTTEIAENVGGGKWKGPYIQNCTSNTTTGTGLRVDGDQARSLKAMNVDAYTQYNQGGVGVAVTNGGFAQLVSLFTICCNEAVTADKGGQADIANSNCSFGTKGLVARGVGDLQFTGIVTSSAAIAQDNVTLNVGITTSTITGVAYTHTTGEATITTSAAHNFAVGMGVSLSSIVFSCTYGNKTYPHKTPYVFDVESIPSATSFTVNIGISTLAHTYQSGGTAKIDVDRPYDGQLVYFDTLYQSVETIAVGSGGTGYTSTPTVTVAAPAGPSGETATAFATLEGETVASVTIISSGSQYESTPSVTISAPNVGINTATATASMSPIYYTINSSTPVVSGITTLTLDTNLLSTVGVGSTAFFSQASRIVASSHTFEYVGSGNDITSATPKRGGVTIQANEVVTSDGGKVLYTSTDQAGNFRIGDGLQINQETGTISGRAFSKSLFSEMTPFILALS